MTQFFDYVTCLWTNYNREIDESLHPHLPRRRVMSESLKTTEALLLFLLNHFRPEVKKIIWKNLKDFQTKNCKKHIISCRNSHQYRLCWWCTAGFSNMCPAQGIQFFSFLIQNCWFFDLWIKIFQKINQVFHNFIFSWLITLQMFS